LLTYIVFDKFTKLSIMSLGIGVGFQQSGQPQAGFQSFGSGQSCQQAIFQPGLAGTNAQEVRQQNA
jgi:hypothetical protein